MSYHFERMKPPHAVGTRIRSWRMKVLIALANLKWGLGWGL